MDLLNPNAGELPRLDNFISRAHLALAYLRQRLAAGTGLTDLEVTISEENMPPLAERWAAPQHESGEDAYEAPVDHDEEYHVSEEDVPAPTGHEDD